MIYLKECASKDGVKSWGHCPVGKCLLRIFKAMNLIPVKKQMNQCLTVALNEQFLRIKIWLAVLGRIYFHAHTDVFLVLNELCFQSSVAHL